MSKWSEYYKDRVNNREYEEAFASKYYIFLHYIVKKIDASFDKKSQIRNIWIKEEGCGIGTVSKMACAWYAPYLFCFSDIDPDILKLCKQNNDSGISECIADGVNYTYLIEDILSSDKMYKENALVVTHGVLEHFYPKDVKKIIDGYNANNKVIGHIHYVPTDKYLKPSFGDERLCLVEEWVDLIKPTRYIVDNSGKDLYLITEKV